jgi:hypothetical protein
MSWGEKIRMGREGARLQGSGGRVQEMPRSTVIPA